MLYFLGTMASGRLVALVKFWVSGFSVQVSGQQLIGQSDRKKKRLYCHVSGFLFVGAVLNRDQDTSLNDYNL